jgi:hypothetical protein
MTPASQLFEKVLGQIATCKDLYEYHESQRRHFGLRSAHWDRSAAAISGAIDSLRQSLSALEDVRETDRKAIK